MIVYMTQGQKTVLSRITVEGLPLHYLSVGRDYFARRRALRCLRQMYDSGVRRCICADVYLLSLAKQADITSYPVLPLRLALLGSLLDILCPGGLQNAAAVLRCGPGGEETARAALTVLAIVVTVFVQAAMDAFFKPWGIATLTGPFCITTWLFLLPAYKLSNIFSPHTEWKFREPGDNAPR